MTDGSTEQPSPQHPVARVVVVVPSPDPARLARACAGLGATGHVVPADGPCAVVLDAGVDADAAVQKLSRVLGRAPVLLLRSADGRVEAQRWARGVLVETPQPGLLVASLPDVVSRLLVGALIPQEVPGAVRTGLRPRAVDDRAGSPALDPARPARRRRTDRVAAALVAVVALLFAAVECLRAAGGTGSWTAVALALLVGAGMAVLAVRLRPRPEPVAGTSPDDVPPVASS